jgi:hypothetical protein
MQTYTKLIKHLLLFIVTLSVAGTVKAQISPVYDNDPKIQRLINKGDSLFFEEQYSESALSYMQVINTKYDAYIYLNTCRAYVKLADQSKVILALKQLADTGFKDYWIFETEPDFARIKNQKDVLPVFDQIKRNFKKYADSAKIKYPDLAVELFKMRNEDQKYQPMRAYMAKYPNAYKNYNRDSLLVMIRKAFVENSKTLARMTDKAGFLGYKEVGADASRVGWLIAQHADSNRVFQEHYLTLMEIALKNNNASHNNYAYLLDRVRKGSGKKQVYGTQLVYTTVTDSITNKSKVNITLWPVEDEAKLNELRKQANLPPIEEYLELVRRN